MREQPIAQLRLEPGALGRHYVAAVGDVEKLLNGNGIKAEGRHGVAVLHALLELAEAADAAHEIDAVVGARILDAQDAVEYSLLENAYVEHTDRIVAEGAFLRSQGVPLVSEIHT